MLCQWFWENILHRRWALLLLLNMWHSASKLASSGLFCRASDQRLILLKEVATGVSLDESSLLSWLQDFYWSLHFCRLLTSGRVGSCCTSWWAPFHSSIFFSHLLHLSAHLGIPQVDSASPKWLACRWSAHIPLNDQRTKMIQQNCRRWYRYVQWE